MKKVALVLLFCLPVLMNAYSQTKKESLKELFHLMDQDSLMDKMFNSVVSTVSNQMQGMVKDSTDRVRSNEMMESTMKTLRVVSNKMMDEDMVSLYDKYFSQKEVDDLVAFYKSSTGQKMIKVMPDIQKDIMEIFMQKYMPEVLKTLQSAEMIKMNSGFSKPVEAKIVEVK